MGFGSRLCNSRASWCGGVCVELPTLELHCGSALAGPVAVSDPDCSRPAPGRPSGSGSAGAMSRVSRALREQRGGGCVRLDERRASRAACLSCGLCAQLTWPSRYCGTTVSIEALGRGEGPVW